MLPFDLQPQSGKPISEQLVYAVKKALAQKRLQPGDSFPSVRTLSRELRMNPNTAQKAVSQLTQLGILEIQPGIGARVCDRAPLSPHELAAILDDPIESLVVEARQLGLTKTELEQRLRDAWKNLNL